MNGKWIKTTKEVYFNIYETHKEDLGVFSSFSNPTPSHLQHTCEMMTEWGFKNSDFPIIKYQRRWDHEAGTDSATTEYFLFLPKKEE